MNKLIYKIQRRVFQDTLEESYPFVRDLGGGCYHHALLRSLVNLSLPTGF